MRIDDRRQHTVGEVLRLCCENNPDKVFLLVDEDRVTYRDIDLLSNRLANGLHGIGVGHQENVLLMLPDCVDFIAAWMGLSKIGAVEVPINRAYQGDLLVHLVNDSQAQRLVIAVDFLPQLDAVADRLDTLREVICYPCVPEKLSERLKRFDIRSFDCLVQSPETPPPVAGPAYNDLVAVLYTSGTTGASKGVMIYHAHAYEFSSSTAQTLALGADDTFFAPLPMFHIAGQWGVVYAAMICDATVVLTERFSTRAYWDVVRRYQVNVAILLDVMANFLLAQPATAEDATNTLDRVHMSAVIPELDEFRRRFGVRVTTDLASTEMCVPLRAGYVGEPHEFYDLPDHRTCGREISDRFEVKLVDENDEEVPIGEVGELVVRSRYPWTLMGGYWRNPEATARAWRNLWFHTGDALYRDAQGNHYFVDRTHDVMRRRGENISSMEVEDAVNAHPEVAESAVVGVKSPLGGHEVMAVVTRVEGSTLSEAALIDFLQTRLADFMVPRYLDFQRTIPKTQTGKIQKYPLREQGVVETTWDREAAAKR